MPSGLQPPSLLLLVSWTLDSRPPALGKSRLPTQPAETAAFPDDARARDRAHGGDGVDRKLPLLASEVGAEVCTGAVVLPHIVVVDRLLEETALGNRCVDGRR